MLDNHPLVSVIIPTYNRAHLIGETLDSVLVQTYTNWECIVIDDGSTDNTDDVVGAYVAKDPRFKYYHRPPEHLAGGNGARNYGFKMSRGEYVNWFDSDDLMAMDKLLLQVKQLKNSSYKFCVCQTLVFADSINNTLGLRKPKINSKDNFNDFICNEIKFLTQAPVFKKEFLTQNNLLFDETLVQSQERDFFIKVLGTESNYEIIEKPLVYFRKHESSISSTKTNSNKCYSNFRVSIMPLILFKPKLNLKSVNILKKSIKLSFHNALLLGDRTLINKIKADFTKVESYFTNLEILKLNIGLVTMQYFKKGWIFFK